MKNFKKLLAVMLVICMLPVIPLTVFAEDSATNTATTFSAAVEAGYVTKDETTTPATYTLTSNFTLSETDTSITSGKIDGAGYTITTSAPIFASFAGTVENLTMTGAVAVSGTTGTNDTERVNNECFGVLANKVEATTTLTNVTNSANITATVFYKQDSVGGFVGKNTATLHFNNCVNTGTITVTGQTTVGQVYVGGFVGEANGYTTFTNCKNAGNISSTSGAAGGYIGYGSGEKAYTFNYSTNTGKIAVNATGNCGQYAYCNASGFVGVTNSKKFVMNTCYNMGEVVVTTNSNVNATDGYRAHATGFVSGNKFNATADNNTAHEIKNSYNGGKVWVNWTGSGTNGNDAAALVSEYNKNTSVNWTEDGIAKLTSNNYVVVGEGYATDVITFLLSDVNSANKISVTEADGVYSGYDYIATVSELKDGTLTEALNESSNAFFQKKNAYPDLFALYPNKSIDDYWETSDGSSYTVSGDIVITETYTTKFTGTLTGTDCTIYTNVPVFADVAATISNLTIEGEIVDSTTNASWAGVAALARITSGETKLSNIVNKAKVTYTKAPTSDQVCVAAMVGHSEHKLTIEDCKNYGDISSDYGAYNKRVYVASMVGGYRGSDVSVTRCFNYGNITSTSISGGLIGRTTNESGKTAVYESGNEGNIYTKTAGGSLNYAFNCAGGLIGANANKYLCVSDSYNVGDVYSEATAKCTSDLKPTAGGLFTLVNLSNTDGMITNGDSYVNNNISLGKVTAKCVEGDSAYAGLIFADFSKSKGEWTNDRLNFIDTHGKTNYVNETDPFKVFNVHITGNTTDEGKLIEKLPFVNIGFEMQDAAAIRLYAENETGIRFFSDINKDAYGKLGTTFDDIKLGTMFVVTDKLADKEFTHEALDAAGVVYLDAVRASAFGEGDLESDEDPTYELKGSIVGITSTYFDKNVSARAYIKIGDTYIYASGKSTANVKAIAEQAAKDTEKYTPEQIELLQAYAAAQAE